MFSKPIPSVFILQLSASP